MNHHTLAYQASPAPITSPAPSTSLAEDEHSESIEETRCIPVSAPPISPSQRNRTVSCGALGFRIAKRTLDVLFSALVIVALFVPSLALCIAIAWESPGAPIYRQPRVGRAGKTIRIFKFRSMVADADDVHKYLSPSQLEQWSRERKVDHDPRITRIGAFLRRTSLDEVPQFLNVFRGDMSVIGPRPITQDELVWFSDDVDTLLSANMGITGWWQTSSRNDATYEDGSRQQLELFYVKNACGSLDAEIFVKTVSAMVRNTGR